MRVMCIIPENAQWAPMRPVPFDERPVFGEICTVVEESEKYYALAGYHPESIAFIKDGFVPLSEAEELELHAEYILQTKR